MSHLPPRPSWVEAFNTVGESLGGASHVVPIDGARLIEDAVRTTGLDDFGDDSWREAYAVLLEAIAREADLNLVGRVLTHSEIARLLQNRLRIVETRKRHPEIAEIPVRAPIVITGTARSGTSILHELLAQDPAHRSPRAWEVMYSVPPPEPATFETDPRIERADREVTLWHDVAPEYKTMHENGGALPLECIFLMAHEFRSNHFSGVLDVPSYAVWLATHDLRPAFRFHRDQLQLLGFKWGPVRSGVSAPRLSGARVQMRDNEPDPLRWLLKAPSHLSVLPALFAVYPDARLILTHRDPAKTVPSTASLMATLRRMRRDRVDAVALGRQLAMGMAAGLDRVIEQRATGEIPDSQIVDLHYHELISDPFGTIRRTYERLGLELTEVAEERMRAYLAAKPRAKHGAHPYAPEDFGLERAALRERFATYMRKYDVAAESG
ncbi:MAG: sulfotransferase [Deltaproteobacteria bacterium]|nr:sulfotransferase [Deltaproteobacteria bacterium]